LTGIGNIEDTDASAEMIMWHELRHAPKSGTLLCETSDIKAGEAKEFRFGGDSPFAFRLFIHNANGTFKAYRNACPHYDVPLNHTPGEVFTSDRQHFLCMTHYAKFETTHGRCVEGPCEGEFLEHIPLTQEGNLLFVGEIVE
jgi:nitrite reductase/ring-hydroxylating ferredoxin subunit